MHVREVLTADEVREVGSILDRASWGDGRQARGSSAQGAVFLHDLQMIERTTDQRLEMALLQIHILGRVDTGLCGFAQWFRTQSAKTDNEDVRPLSLYLRDSNDGSFAAEIEE